MTYKPVILLMVMTSLKPYGDMAHIIKIIWPDGDKKNTNSPYRKIVFIIAFMGYFLHEFRLKYGCVRSKKFEAMQQFFVIVRKLFLGLGLAGFQYLAQMGQRSLWYAIAGKWCMYMWFQVCYGS